MKKRKFFVLLAAIWFCILSVKTAAGQKIENQLEELRRWAVTTFINENTSMFDKATDSLRQKLTNLGCPVTFKDSINLPAPKNITVTVERKIDLNIKNSLGVNDINDILSLAFMIPLNQPDQKIHYLQSVLPVDGLTADALDLARGFRLKMLGTYGSEDYYAGQKGGKPKIIENAEELLVYMPGIEVEIIGDDFPPDLFYKKGYYVFANTLTLNRGEYGRYRASFRLKSGNVTWDATNKLFNFIGLSGLSISDKGREVHEDFFFTSGINKIRLQSRLEDIRPIITHGKEEIMLDYPPIKSTKLAYKTYGNNITGFDLKEIGEARVEVSLAVPGGKALSATYRANMARLSLKTDTDSAGTISTGKYYTSKLEVEGPVDMKKYNIKIHPDLAEFSRLFDVSSSQDIVNINKNEQSFKIKLAKNLDVKELLKNWGKFALYVSTQLINNDKKEHYEFSEKYVLRPTISDLTLKTGNDVLDIFLTGGTSSNTSLTADVKFADDISLKDIPVNDMPFVTLQQDSSDKLVISKGGVLSARQDAVVGVSKVRALIKESGDVATGGNDITSNELNVTINKPYLIYLADKTILSVEGPADMTKYSALWRTADGRNQQTSFSNVAGGFRAEIDSPNIQLVTIVQGNKEIAVIKPEKSNMLNAVIDIYAPTYFVPNEKYTMYAVIKNIPEELVSKSYCIWDIEPGYSSVIDKNTFVIKTQNGYVCETSVMFFGDNNKMPNRYPKITVDVYMKTQDISK